VWRLATGEIDGAADREEGPADEEIIKAAHRTLKRVTEDIERLHFNTAVAALMEYGNALRAYVGDGARRETLEQAIELMILMLAPMAPHLAHELWELTGHDGILAKERWPEWDPELVTVETVTMIIQVNGKVRDRVDVDATISDDEATSLALASERVQAYTEGEEPARVIVRAPKLVNVVVQ
jgi:leucyl-tRNA synthetase